MKHGNTKFNRIKLLKRIFAQKVMQITKNNRNLKCEPEMYHLKHFSNNNWPDFVIDLLNKVV